VILKYSAEYSDMISVAIECALVWGVGSVAEVLFVLIDCDVFVDGLG
jgi:hypothetical protein